MRERNVYQQKLVLFVLDMLAFFGALHGAIWLRYSANLPFSKGGSAPWEQILEAFPFVAMVWLLVSAAFGSYRIRQSAFQESSALIRATLVTFLAVLSATFFYRGFSYSRGMIGFFIPLVLVAVISARLVFRALRRRALRRFAGRDRIAILGQSRIGTNLIHGLLRDADYHEVVGYIEIDSSHFQVESEAAEHNGATGARDESLTPWSDSEQELPRLGHVSDIEELCNSDAFDSLILVDRTLTEPVVLDTIDACLRHQVSWSMIPAVHELLLDRARVDLIDGIPLVGMRRSNIVGFNWMLKRATDIVVSILALIVVSPVMLAVAIGIKLSSPGSVFYVHQRVGHRGKTFPFLKFRSMHTGNDDTIHREYTRKWIENNEAHTQEGDKEVHKIVNDPRVFALGRFIRRYSIDELPQLLNVLRGEMSLIGPRPAIPYEVDVYREWHRRRLEAPPGITGLWQVSGRNRLSFEEMVKLDIDYLENWSLLLDLRILLRTVRVVLFEHAF